jgi:hypothetical protein
VVDAAVDGGDRVGDDLTLLKIPAAVVAVTATDPSTVTDLRNWQPRSPA